MINKESIQKNDKLYDIQYLYFDIIVKKSLNSSSTLISCAINLQNKFGVTTYSKELKCN